MLMYHMKMTKVISFRVTEEEWLAIERAAARSGNKTNEWCRMITLETVQIPEGLSPNEWLMFSQIARTQLLVAIGFQMLSDDKLDTEEWKNFRASARANLKIITDRALEDVRPLIGGNNRE